MLLLTVKGARKREDEEVSQVRTGEIGNGVFWRDCANVPVYAALNLIRSDDVKDRDPRNIVGGGGIYRETSERVVMSR